VFVQLIRIAFLPVDVFANKAFLENHIQRSAFRKAHSEKHLQKTCSFIKLLQVVMSAAARLIRAYAHVYLELSQLRA
jgi:hypothetical protein